jgi:hypothetical protein
MAEYPVITAGNVRRDVFGLSIGYLHVWELPRQRTEYADASVMTDGVLWFFQE